MLLFLRSLAISLWASCFLLAPRVAATPPVGGYAIRSWQTEDGLPLNSVISAVQTKEGFLWFGTYTGLARFDGESFRVFNANNTAALEDGRISSLFEDAQGTMWIGHESGLITKYQHDGFETVPLHANASREKVIAIGGDERGRVWAFREKGSIDAVVDGTQLPSILGAELPGIMSWNRGADGQIWLSENGRMARLRNNQIEPCVVETDRQPDYVLCVAASQRGGSWLICGGQNIRRWENGQWVEDRGKYPAPPGSVSCCLELHDGTVALGTIYSGLYLIFKDGRPPAHFDQSNGLPQNWVRFLYEDRENNLWIGSGSAGLAAIHRSPFSQLNAPDHWQGRSVLCIAPGKDNSLWIGTEGSGLYHLVDGNWIHYGEQEGLENQYIWAITKDAGDQIWAGYYWWGGPARMVNDRFSRLEQMDTRSAAVLCLEENPPKNELLVGNREGLMRLTEKDVTWLYRSEPGASADVCTVVRDAKNVIWFGLAQNGLGRIENGRVKIFKREDGLSSNAIQCLLTDDQTGTLWIGTVDAGIMRYQNGKFARIGTGQGMFDNSVCHILDDGRGYLWLSSHRGIQRVAKSELDRCADGLTGWINLQSYDRSYGLPAMEFTGGRQGAGCKTSDGRLWFASSGGVVTVDPSSIQPNLTVPPVIVESLTVDEKEIPFVDAEVKPRLSPALERIEIHYAGLSFVAPSRVLFRYKLEGIDKDWVPAGDRRIAYYSRLPAGKYRFRVIGSNDDGVWNLEGAALAFVVAPYFWQTWWFIGLCSVTILSGVAWLVRSLTRRRILRRVEELERLHAIERERSRIARDIHDDLGGNLTHIAILSQPAREEMQQPQQATQILSGIYSAARDGIRALDEIVWAVDPQHDTLDSLVSYMGKYAADLLDAVGIRCRLDFPLDLPTWPLGTEIRHNLFLAFKEALNNSLKHAAATEVQISLSLAPNAFTFTLQDNGRGFDPKEKPARSSDRIASGHGLPNLQRRLTAIGGRCEITSAKDQGTRISFIVLIQPERSPSAPTVN